METKPTKDTKAPDYAQRATELHAALAAALEDIRAQSYDSALVTPNRWAREGMAPDWMDNEAFTAAVMDAIAKRDEGTTEPLEADAQDEPHDSRSDEQPDSLETALAALPAIPCADICVLSGKKAQYLYSNAFMTDAYANWAFLAQEDDKVQTFVTVVREDSRVYPRPMVYRSLLNPPFRMTEDEVLQCWQTVQETGEFPDIASCEASNGDVYFFSTDYLSLRYAQSLAEYESVERLANP